MKRLINSLVFLFLMIGLSGCYTIVQNSKEYYQEPEIIVYYPVPVPVPPPDPGPCPIPVPPNNPPSPNPDPQPIIRHPINPDRGGETNPTRDPLRGHGERGNTERNKSRR